MVLTLRVFGLGRRRYSTSRQLQKATWRVSVVTRTMMEWQNTQPSDRVSLAIVQRGIEMRAGSSMLSSIISRIGRTGKI